MTSLITSLSMKMFGKFTVAVILVVLSSPLKPTAFTSIKFKPDLTKTVAVQFEGLVQTTALSLPFIKTRVEGLAVPVIVTRLVTGEREVSVVSVKSFVGICDTIQLRRESTQLRMESNASGVPLALKTPAIGSIELPRDAESNPPAKNL